MNRKPSLAARQSRRSSACIDVPACFMTGNKLLKKIMANREQLSFDSSNFPKNERDILHKALQTPTSFRATAEIGILLTYVGTFPLFANFSSEHIAGVIEGSSLRRCEPLSILCAEAASSVEGHLFIVISGKVGTCSQTQTGLWKAIKSKAVFSATDNALDMVRINQEMVFIAGDSFGEECILQDCLGIYERTAITQTECILMEVTSPHALQIIRDNLKLRVQFRPQFFLALMHSGPNIDQKLLKTEVFSHTRDWTLMKRLTREAGLKFFSMTDVVEVMANKPVFLQGDRNDFVYVVFQGEVDVFLNSSSERRLTSNEIRREYPMGPVTMEEKKLYGQHVARMHCGQIFGDFYDDTSNNTRSASVICSNEDCILLRISKDAYVDNFILTASMVYSAEHWVPALSRDPAERTTNDIQLLMHMATSVPLLQRFPKIERQHILREMCLKNIEVLRCGEASNIILPRYEVVIEEGQIVESDPAMFWVLQGTLQVRSLKHQTKSTICSPFAEMDETQLEIALDASFGTLDFIVREGRIVGESILLTDVLHMTRTASVIAVGPATLGVINRSICHRHIPVRNEFQTASHIRNSILAKLPMDRTEDEIRLLYQLCLETQVLQHLPGHVSHHILREAHGMQLYSNEVAYVQNSKANYFGILLEGSLTSHSFHDVGPLLKINEQLLFVDAAEKRRILKSILPPVADVRITRVRA
jgi:CRP-like cAMP-binding protein